MNPPDVIVPPRVAEDSAGRLLQDLTPTQREAVGHQTGPLLIIAGAGTGKTTVITRRIAWLITTKQARPEEILALTFTEKAAREMGERVDVLVPYGYADIALSTFHAFGDRLLREHAVEAGLAPNFRVLSKAEQIVFLRRHAFDLPLEQFRPLHDPTRYLSAIATVIARAKDEAVSPEEFIAFAQSLRTPSREESGEPHRLSAAQTEELAQVYAAYQRLLRHEGAADFGDQVLLVIRLFEQHPELLERSRRQFKYVLVDEFQDTNYAQFRLLELLAPPTANVTAVADDDQSIYKWRGAALSNVLKFLEHYPTTRRIVLTENFRSSQAVLDCAYRLIRFNDPERLEVKERIEKRLMAMCPRENKEPALAVFDTASSEADWIAREIQKGVASGKRRPGDYAILVRSNREADPFLRALNVCGMPWQFSGSGGVFANEAVKLLVSCLKTLADPEDSLSWFHVASSPLYDCPMGDLTRCFAIGHRTNQSLRRVVEQLRDDGGIATDLSETGKRRLLKLLSDVDQLVELSRSLSPGQLLFRWLKDSGWLQRALEPTQAGDETWLESLARFFDSLRKFELLIGDRLPAFMEHLELFQAFGEGPREEPDQVSRDRVNVLTIHKAKGLEFPVVFLVGLVQGRFPTPARRDPLELPESLIKDVLPAGDYHLQEERRLFYVGMTRAQEELHLTAAYDYGGRSVRKVSQFVLEALNLASPAPAAKAATLRELIERSQPPPPAPEVPSSPQAQEPLRLDAHGIDDYLTCPLKYRYSHVLRLPIMRHHLVIYGAALHKAVETFFTRRLHGQPVSLEELLKTFEHAWSSEGFLTREHEELRLAQGRQVLSRFFERQQTQPEFPTLIEAKFHFQLEDVLVVGRWDRVDQRGEEVVIIDYKSSDIRDQATANRRTRDSLQMAVYALAWRTIHGKLPTRLELRFLETEVTGQATLTEEDLKRTTLRILEVAKGIRARDFHAEPAEFACRWCAYQSICPFAILAPK